MAAPYKRGLVACSAIGSGSGPRPGDCGIQPDRWPLRARSVGRMGVRRGDHVRYTAAPPFDSVIRKGDTGIVVAVEDELVRVKWPNGAYSVPVGHVRRIRRVPRARRVEELVRWLRAQRDTVLEPGLDAGELARAEERFGVVFPPLWRDVLARAHPVDPDIDMPEDRRCPDAWYPDWRLREPERTGRLVDAPVNGVLREVEHENFWWRTWGPRPADPADRVATARQRLADVPRLAPLFHTLYAAATDDSPVFSIDRTTVTIPALHLAELPIHDGHDVTALADRPARGVEFWSELHADGQSRQADR